MTIADRDKVKVKTVSYVASHQMLDVAEPAACWRWVRLGMWL
jgi:hypothetical protein